MNYKALIREVPDFPKPGILFYDITTLLKTLRPIAPLPMSWLPGMKARAFAKVIGIESRGSSSVAPGGQTGGRIRACPKAGKTAADIFEVEYNLEYGSSVLAIHRDAVAAGERC